MSRSKEKNKELIILRIQRTPLLWRAFACSNPLMINIIISMYRIEKLERLCCALKIHSCVSVFIEHLYVAGNVPDASHTEVDFVIILI